MRVESAMPSIDFEAIVKAIPGNHVFLLPDAPTFTIIGATNSFLRTSYTTREQLIGKSLFEVFPDNTADDNATGVSNLQASLNYVLDQKVKHVMVDQRYDIVNPDTGAFEFKVWTAFSEPVLNTEGAIQYIIHTTEDITEKVRLREESASKEEKLQESESNFRLMVEQAPMPVLFSRGEDVIIESLNAPMLKAMSKSSFEEVLGKKMVEALPELENQEVLQIVKNVQKTGVPFRGDEVPTDVIINNKLERFYFNYSYTPIIEANQITGVLHVANDITQQVEARKKVEESQAALIKSEARYRTLFESMDQGFCVLEVICDESGEPIDYRFLEVNPAFEKQTGLIGAINKTARQLVPALEEHWVKLYGKVALTSDALRFSEESKAMGRWFDVYAFKIEGRDSRKVALLFTDITEKKEAEETLKTLGKRQSFLLKLSDRLRSLTDPTEMQYEAACLLGDHLGANRVGYAEDTGDGETIIVTRNYINGVVGIEGKYKYDDYGPQLLKEFRAGRTVVRNNITEDASLSEEEKQAYQSIQIGASINVPMLKNGRLFGILFMHCETAHIWSDSEIELIKETADRTWEAVERARTQAALQQSEEELEQKVEERTSELAHANEELRRSNQNLEEFAYAASHDLKEPIRKIHFFMDRLNVRLASKLEDEDRRYFERMEMGAKRMATLIDDLLLYSHVSRGAKSQEPVDLNQTLAFVLDDLELHIKEKGARVIVGPLPTINGHPRQLQQLFDNLLANAIKYSRPGTAPEITITTKVIKGDDTALHMNAEERNKPFHLIEVRDNGIGFNQEDADRIFNVFTRLHGNSEYKGSGVGLSIVRKVAENHKGYIWAQSTLGKGTTFKVLLPAD